MSTPYNRLIKDIVIHHMGDGLEPGVPIVGRWNPYGYEFPEYDFGVEEDGTVRVGRPLNVQGAHCLATKHPYVDRGDQWWNQNSIGIGLAGDFTKFPMKFAQLNGLVGLVRGLMASYGLTLDNVYPHGQVTSTDCPGCTYSRISALHGGWNYDDFEKLVLEVKPMTVLDSGLPSVENPDIYLSVRVLKNKADQAILDVNKLGFACKRLDLA